MVIDLNASGVEWGGTISTLLFSFYKRKMDFNIK
jgi:hypothetical protein